MPVLDMTSISARLVAAPSGGQRCGIVSRRREATHVASITVETQSMGMARATPSGCAIL